MAQPAEIVALGEEMAALYRRTQVEVIQELIRIAGMPEQRHYRRKLINQSRELQQHLDQVDAAARAWLQERFPLAYRYGQREADRITGHRSTWTQVHREAVREIAQDTYDNLLEATRYVREDTKRFIRLAVREQSRSVVIAGTRTASAAGRYDLARQLQDHGINAVRYKNGAKHTLQTYGEMVVRTQTAMAHNMGVLNGAYAGGTRWMECSDGYGCGLTFHEDTDAPAGTVQPIEVAMAYPLSHPNCARSWSPRPDIKDPAEAKAAQRLPDEQLARLAELERERAKVKTVTGRLTGRERVRRQVARREARLAARRPQLPFPPSPPPLPPGEAALRRLADEVGLTPAEVQRLQRQLPDVRRQLREAAAAARDDSLALLENTEAIRVASPPRLMRRRNARTGRMESVREYGGGEWDWFFELDPAEQARIRRSPYLDRKGGGGVKPDVLAGQWADTFGGSDDVDRVMREWLTHNRRIEGGNALANGRMPNPKLYGGLGPDDLIDSPYQWSYLYGDEAGAIRHMAEVQADEGAEYAARAFARNRSGYDNPWEMDEDTWVAEYTAYRDEAALFRAEAGDADDWVRTVSPIEREVLDRLEELVPYGLDDPAQPLSPSQMYAAMIRLAKQAGFVE